MVSLLAFTEHVARRFLYVKLVADHNKPNPPGHSTLYDLLAYMYIPFLIQNRNSPYHVSSLLGSTQAAYTMPCTDTAGCVDPLLSLQGVL